MAVEFEKSPWYLDHQMFKGVDRWIPDVVIPQTSIGLKSATEGINKNIRHFQEQYFERHPEREDDRRVRDYFEEMKIAGFWHWLGQIDGYDVNHFESNDSFSEEKLRSNREIRSWAASVFTQEELRQILQYGIDMALTGIHSDAGQPGFKRGHTIIYSHLFKKPESMFSDLPTEGLRKRLNNGRFWENLADITQGYKTPQLKEVEDVLGNHAQDLDVDFFEQGYEIFKRNGGEHHILAPEITKMSNKNVERYWSFVKALDENVYEKEDEKRRRIESWHGESYQKPERTDSRIAFLIRPYLHDIHSNQRAKTHEAHIRQVKARLNDPILQKYLERSDMLRDTLANDLLLHVQNNLRNESYHNNFDADYVAEILPVLPKPRDLLIRMLNQTRDKERYFMHNTRAERKGLELLMNQKGIGISELLRTPDAKLQ